MEPVLAVVGGDVYARQIPRGNVIFGGRSGTADLDVGFGKVNAEENPDNARRERSRSFPVSQTLP